MNNSFVPSEPETIIPDSATYFPPLTTNPSRAKAHETERGVYSNDPILYRNPNELWRFLVSNLRKPGLFIYVRGTSYVGHPGHSKHFTDFSFFINVSEHVSEWSRLDAQSETPGMPTPTVRAMVKEYTRSWNPFKEFRLRKVLLGWDYDRVRELVTNLVRLTGYEDHVEVEFLTVDDEVVATGRCGYSTAAHSRVVRVLSGLSCLCVVLWPVWGIARMRMRTRLVCEYQMAVSADEFSRRNMDMVQKAVQVRKLDELLLAL